jgi:hypothetical protein
MAYIGCPTRAGLHREPPTYTRPPAQDGRPRDDLGFPLPDLAPVRIHHGKPRSEWTQEEEYRHFAHGLGSAFAAGVPRPPKPDAYYLPTGRETYEFNKAAGRFEPKPNDAARQVD